MIRLVHWLVHLKLNVLMYQQDNQGIASHIMQCTNVLKTLVQMYQSNMQLSLIYKGFLDVLIALVHSFHLFRGKERTFPFHLKCERAKTLSYLVTCSVTGARLRRKSLILKIL